GDCDPVGAGAGDANRATGHRPAPGRLCHLGRSRAAAGGASGPAGSPAGPGGAGVRVGLFGRPGSAGLSGRKGRRIGHNRAMKNALPAPLSTLLGLLLAACAAPAPAAPTSTPIDLPPLPTLAGTIPPVAPTAIPTGPESGLEAILLALPGPGSRLTSPVSVQGQSRPTFEQNLVVAVYDADGQLLGLQPTTIEAP